MKKKEIKGLRKKLIVSVKKALTDNNKSLINALEKDLKRSLKVVSVKKARKGETKEKLVATEA